jgi:hypothetical protein
VPCELLAIRLRAVDATCDPNNDADFKHLPSIGMCTRLASSSTCCGRKRSTSGLELLRPGVNAQPLCK